MYDEVHKMKKFIFIILFIFSMQLFPAAVTKYYDKWKVRTITYDNTDAKTVTISLEVDQNLEIYIASRTNQFNITLTWYKDDIDENKPIVQYKFNNSDYYSVEPAMRSSKDNFDILFTISPSFGLVQEQETVDFFNKLLKNTNMTIRPNNYGDEYNVDLSGLKEAIESTDFSGTLFEKYKNQISY